MANPNETGKIIPDNPGPQPASPVQPSQAPNPAADPSANTGSLFFNVMPHGKNGAKAMVEAKIKTQAPQVESQTEADPGFMGQVKNHKLVIIIVAGLVIAGVAGYFLIQKFGGVGYSQENIIVKNPGIPTAAPQTTASSTPVSGADFTTPQDWRDKYFPNCTDPTVCGDDADPDHDGLTNLQEYKLGTDPNNPDSDQDGLSDGDEVNIFGSDPLKSHTAGDPKYSDADYVKGGYDFKTGKLMTAAQIAVVTAKMKQYDLHPTTILTLGNIVNTIYGLSAPQATGTPDSVASASGTPDQSLSAQQDRDAKRSATIKNVEVALVGFQADNKTYPLDSDFASMFASVKPYLKVATNPVDPVNQAPYVYSYTPNADGTDFVLSFYSEIARQAIVKTAADAVKDAAAEQADIYDNQRETDLETLRTALLLYSQQNVAGGQDFVFPSKDKYQTALVPNFIAAIPKDPSTGQDYDYEVSATFDSFTLKAVLQDPPTGTTGYTCNQVDECHNY